MTDAKGKKKSDKMESGEILQVAENEIPAW